MDESHSRDSLIKYGVFLALQKIDGEHVKVFRLTPKLKISHEKLKFDGDSVVGKPYGLFEIVSEQCQPLAVEKLIEEEVEQASSSVEPDAAVVKEVLAAVLKQTDSVEGSTDEQTAASPVAIAPSALRLAVDEARQELTQENVLALKKNGTTTSELVAKLVEGNKAYNTRTVFSQSKYIKRKTQKHSDRALILRPTLRLISSSYYTKDADRIANLRIDQLGMILQMAGIHYNKNVVLFDQTLGLVTAAVVERLGGKGKCVHIHRGSIAQSIPCFHSMSFDEKISSTFLPVRISCLLAGKQLPYDTNRPNYKEGPEEKKSKVEEDVEMNEVKPGTSEGGAPFYEVDEAALKRRQDRLDSEKLGLELIDRGADSLIIATRTVDPVSILEILYPKLRSGSTVVIYGPQLKPLIDAYEWLVKKNAIHMQLVDQMYRVQQVLPDRTHPMMSQHVVGGFLLSAIKAIPPPQTVEIAQKFENAD
ncbi:unnamed protein product [Caenorhabditis auriculariae]|uniref:tRNA (adenine(58)-N(1))-methyltransferase non-catalytic subunit TRM6 n=1 Tax=Caenorhabditis auriculariae TaxID=2777116 RepID=A0A8S1HUV1_9PELO|nr:unnamed protein product [Caenorhabditis auriculariae]